LGTLISPSLTIIVHDAASVVFLQWRLQYPESGRHFVATINL